MKKEKKEILSKHNKAYLDYVAAVNKVQQEELHSKNYKIASDFLNNTYYNRGSLDMEEELFNIIGNHSLENDYLYLTDSDKKEGRIERYKKLLDFMVDLSDEQINSNIFLKSTKELIDNPIDCKIILDRLKNKIGGNSDKLISTEMEIPKTVKKVLPKRIHTTKYVKYYNPKVYKYEYIDALDSEHQHIYNDYNTFVYRQTALVENIYLLQLNTILSNVDELGCEYLQLYYNPTVYGCDDERQLILTFNISPIKKEKENKEEINEELIDETVTNFKKILDLGLVDIDILKEDKNTFTK